MFGLGTKNIGIDLGTANTLVYAEGKGIILNEPSVVVKDVDSDKIIAIGDQAKAMIGRTPANMKTIRPLRDGVISDYDATVSMLQYFLNIAIGKGSKPNVMICVPSGVTEVERRAVIDAANVAGAKNSYVIEEPFAAAVGAGLPVDDPTGNMVVDIGGGTTDIATISLGGIVNSRSIRVAGDKFNEVIINFLRQNKGLLVGEPTAEKIKINIGSASIERAKEIDDMEVRGRDIVTGLPIVINISAEDIAYALSDFINEIVVSVKETLEETPPEIAADISDHGIVLSGGGAMLKFLPEVISDQTKVPTFIAPNPLDAVVMGTGESLKNIKNFKANI